MHTRETSVSNEQTRTHIDEGEKRGETARNEDGHAANATIKVTAEYLSSFTRTHEFGRCRAEKIKYDGNCSTEG